MYPSPRQPGGRKRRGGRGLTAECDVIAPPSPPPPRPGAVRGAAGGARSPSGPGRGQQPPSLLRVPSPRGGEKKGKAGRPQHPVLLAGSFQFAIFLLFLFFFSLPVLAAPAELRVAPRGAAPADTGPSSRGQPQGHRGPRAALRGSEWADPEGPPRAVGGEEKLWRAARSREEKFIGKVRRSGRKLPKF